MINLLETIAKVLLETETDSKHSLASSIESPKMSPKRTERGKSQSAPKN
jgi:hypothetical protein